MFGSLGGVLLLCALIATVCIPLVLIVMYFRELSALGKKRKLTHEGKCSKEKQELKRKYRNRIIAAVVAGTLLCIVLSLLL